MTSRARPRPGAAAENTAQEHGDDETRRDLLERLAHTRAELDDRRRAAAPGGERPGFGKRAGDYVAQVVDDRTNNQLADSLAATAGAIEQALTLLDEGHYGLCRDCREPIGAARLEAVPWAPRCMRCEARASRAGFFPARAERHHG